MAAKQTQSMVQLLTVIFTSLIAPVLVSVIARDLSDQDPTPANTEPTRLCQKESPTPSVHASLTVNRSPQPVQSPAVQTPLPPMATPPDALIQVIAQGTGHTPEEAFQQAVRTALSKALAAQVDVDTWSRSGPLLADDAVRNADRIIRGCRSLGATKQWKLGGSVHHTEVAIDMDRLCVAGPVAVRRHSGFDA